MDIFHVSLGELVPPKSSSISSGRKPLEIISGIRCVQARCPFCHLIISVKAQTLTSDLALPFLHSQWLLMKGHYSLNASPPMTIPQMS